jgi:hypothetical protein
MLTGGNPRRDKEINKIKIHFINFDFIGRTNLCRPYGPFATDG